MVSEEIGSYERAQNDFPATATIYNPRYSYAAPAAGLQRAYPARCSLQCRYAPRR